MAGRKIRDAADAQRCIAAADGAGLTLGEWARKHGVDGRSLHLWRVNLSGRQGRRGGRESGGELRLVELVPERPAMASRFTVRVGQVTVDVDEHFDEGALRRLLAVVSSC